MSTARLQNAYPLGFLHKHFISKHKVIFSRNNQKGVPSTNKIPLDNLRQNRKLRLECAPREAWSLRRAVIVGFFFFTLAAETITRSRSTRASCVDVHGILCAILAPMPFVGFTSFNIIYHSYHFYMSFQF